MWCTRGVQAPWWPALKQCWVRGRTPGQASGRRTMAGPRALVNPPAFHPRLRGLARDGRPACRSVVPAARHPLPSPLTSALRHGGATQPCRAPHSRCPRPPHTAPHLPTPPHGPSCSQGSRGGRGGRSARPRVAGRAAGGPSVPPRPPAAERAGGAGPRAGPGPGPGPMPVPVAGAVAVPATRRRARHPPPRTGAGDSGKHQQRR